MCVYCLSHAHVINAYSSRAGALGLLIASILHPKFNLRILDLHVFSECSLVDHTLNSCPSRGSSQACVTGRFLFTRSFSACR